MTIRACSCCICPADSHGLCWYCQRLLPRFYPEVRVPRRLNNDILTDLLRRSRTSIPVFPHNILFTYAQFLIGAYVRGAVSKNDMLAWLRQCVCPPPSIAGSVNQDQRIDDEFDSYAPVVVQAILDIAEEHAKYTVILPLKRTVWRLCDEGNPIDHEITGLKHKIVANRALGRGVFIGSEHAYVNVHERDTGILCSISQHLWHGSHDRLSIRFEPRHFVSINSLSFRQGVLYCQFDRL